MQTHEGPVLAIENTKPEIHRYLDALPYIDVSYEQDAQLAEQVNNLIKKEMRKFEPRDYLAHIPYPNVLSDEKYKILEQEAERIERELKEGKKDVQIFEKTIDFERYQLKPPKNDKLEDWLKALERAQTLNEYEKLKSLNLHLMNQYGTLSWQVFLSNLDGIKKSLEGDVKKVQEATIEVNKKRKLEQMEAAQQLFDLENEYNHLVRKNLELKEVCTKLERQLKKIKK